MTTKLKTYMACPWACGGKVHRRNAGKLCPTCRAFLRTYRTAKVFRRDTGAGDERYANVKAGRVELYAALASAKLPLFDATAGGRST